jgi:hypothetical protein
MLKKEITNRLSGSRGLTACGVSREYYIIFVFYSFLYIRL